ncbi:MAG: DUF1848 domain-containing protein [Bacilli bacterium]
MSVLIVSASRRTDIPAFFSEWFYSRLRAGYLYVKNPFNPRQIKRVSLRKEDVTCFVFWTKNPEKFIERIDELAGYDYYFQFTLTPYGNDAEPRLPEKEKLLECFIDLSRKIGKERIVWRYDPILVSKKNTQDFHFRMFEKFSERLANHAEKCVISFLDMYRNTQRNAGSLGLKEITVSESEEIAASLSKIAGKYGLRLECCSEPHDFSRFSIPKAKCIDGELIARISGKELAFPKDKNQRKECGCASSVDIGAYNTCLHSCLYCYANYNPKAVLSNIKKHDPGSPLLLGK